MFGPVPDILALLALLFAVVRIALPKAYTLTPVAVILLAIALMLM